MPGTKATDRAWLKGRNKYLTGFCANGQCEGTRPKNFQGTPLSVCPMWDTCPCKCHFDLDKMFEMVNRTPDRPIKNPEYNPPKNQFWMPGDDDDLPPVDVPLPVPGMDAPSDHERRPMTPPRAPAGPIFSPTPTGRKARGQLEQEVLEVCADFMRDVFDWEYCLPKLVAEEIGKRATAETPSTGAINACWDRWEKMGIAVQAKKPSRLVKWADGFTGTWEDLLKRKDRMKREKRRTVQAAKRGTIRPREPRKKSA